jgi:hypothetical protein
MREKRAGDYVGAVFGNIVAIAFVNTVPLWQHLTAGVITERWVDILWAANLSLAVQIVGNLLLLLYRPGWFQSFMQAVFSAAGLFSLIVFFIVFPLDFSRVVGEWLNLAVKVAIIVGMGVTFIVTVVSIVRMLMGSVRRS